MAPEHGHADAPAAGAAGGTAVVPRILLFYDYT